MFGLAEMLPVLPVRFLIPTIILNLFLVEFEPTDYHPNFYFWQKWKGLKIVSARSNVLCP